MDQGTTAEQRFFKQCSCFHTHTHTHDHITHLGDGSRSRLRSVLGGDFARSGGRSSRGRSSRGRSSRGRSSRGRSSRPRLIERKGIPRPTRPMGLKNCSRPPHLGTTYPREKNPRSTNATQTAYPTVKSDAKQEQKHAAFS